MSRVHGKNAAFKVDDSGSTLRDISTYCDDVSGLPGARSLDTVTGFGDGGVKSVPGLENSKFTVSGSWDPTTTTGPDAVLAPLRTATATSSFEFGPEGSTSGKVKYSGECWLEEYTVDVKVDGKVPFKASFMVDGTVTRGAFS